MWAWLIMDRLLDVLDKERMAFDLTYVSTVLEEPGLIGAESAARDSGCEMAIALDVGLAGDVPGVDAAGCLGAPGFGSHDRSQGPPFL